MSELTPDQTQAALVEHFKVWPREALHPDLVPHLREDGPVGPMIHHPLVVDLFAHPTTYGNINARYRWAQERVATARAQGDWQRYVFMHERPYRAEALAEAEHCLSASDFAAVARDVWVDSENIHENLDFWLEVFNRTSGHDWMDVSERAELAALPDVIRVHRGECNDGQVSWTRHRPTAVFFANRRVNESTGVVVSGYVDKCNVFAYLTSRGEQELLILNRNHVRTRR